MNRHSGSIMKRTFSRSESTRDKLAGDLDEAVELLSKESAKTDEHGNTYSPDCLGQDSDKFGEDPFMR